MSSQPGRRPVCLHFLRGQCTRDSACRYAHDASRADEAPLCTYYARGSCNRGDSCLYRHGSADARAPAAAAVAAGAPAMTGRRPQREQHSQHQEQRSRQHQQQEPAPAVAAASVATHESNQRAVQAPPPEPNAPADPSQPQLTRQQKKKLRKKQNKKKKKSGQQAQPGAGPSLREQRALCVLRYPTLEEEEALMRSEDYWEAYDLGGPFIEELPPDEPTAPTGETAPPAGQPAQVAAAGGQGAAGGGEEGEEEEDEEDYDTKWERRMREARAAVARGDPPPPLPARYCEDQSLVVAEEFAEICWCEPCKRSFRDPQGLLSHTTHSHAGSEKIAQLRTLRGCPCGCTFSNVSQLGRHIRDVHSGLAPPPGVTEEEMLDGEAIAEAMIQEALMGGLLGSGFGGGSDYDSEGSEEGGMYGFSSDDVFELACQGVKPWDPEAWAVLDVLNGGRYF
ncbi:hypothetical protein ABPG77_008306 [Micractinium sp. CCAP 211/92]